MSINEITLSQSSSEFASNFYRSMLERKMNSKFVISPFFLQSCLALTYTGSDDETSGILVRGLRLPEDDKLTIAKTFQQILQKYSNNSNLHVANKIYLGADVKVKSAFHKTATKYFFSEVENINFSDTTETAKVVNKWVSEKTGEKILNLIDPNSIESHTNLMLVNAVYFKGIWDKFFDIQDTEIRPFWLSDNESKEVNMMFQTGFFKYGLIPELNASALEMKYSHSDIWMLIILPNEPNGLTKLEDNLQTVNLIEISHELTTRIIDVFLPKFTVECDIELQLPMTQLGMGSLYTNPNFSNMIEKENIKVDKIFHKALIEVTEEGAEVHPSSAISLEFSRTIDDLNSVVFKADHPFFFAIKSDSAILFTGRYIFS